MRATIASDDRLPDQLKKRAAESGTSVRLLIERVVRLLPAAAPRRRHRFDLVKIGEGGQFTTLNIDKTAAPNPATSSVLGGSASRCNCRTLTP